MYGYGYYFFNFNYPLPYYLGEAAHLAGFDYVDSIKIVTILGMVLSGLTMFWWQKKHWGNWGGLVSAVFYMYAPYRLVNIYVRGSVAEHLAFVFLPVLFMFTEKIVEENSRWKLLYVILGGVSYGLLTLSHNIMALIFSLVLGLFMLFHLLIYRKWKTVFGFAGVVVSGLLLSAYFWLPSIVEKKFVLLDQTVGQDYRDYFISIGHLLNPMWGYGGQGSMSLQVGFVHLLFLFIAVVAAVHLWKKRHSKALHVFFYLFTFTLSVFFMLPVSRPIWDHVPLLPFTQFPWRFLSWTVFTTSVLAGMVIYVATEHFAKLKRFIPVFAIGAASVLLLADSFYLRANQLISVNLTVDQPIPGSTTWADEQFPVWFKPKPDRVPKERVEVVEGRGRVVPYEWKTARHYYQVIANTKVKIVENTAYYPGWELLVDNELKELDFQDKLYPGRIVYTLLPGDYQISTVFTETPLRKTVDVISLGTGVLVILVLGIILVKANVKRFKN